MPTRPRRAEPPRAPLVPLTPLLAQVDYARSKYGAHSNVEIHLAGEDGFDILEQEADILSPCGYGGVLDEANVAKIRARIVCGAANNQLLDPSHDSGMTAAGITCLPCCLCPPWYRGSLMDRVWPVLLIGIARTSW